ncbi:MULTISPECIES: hypothetical protein [unclassified Variovorax]|uniref:hypothetical protein n=1 Tax=unclassified Variovorax TaxID=663243 RepID=UPI001BD6D636|nr:MULTISPECIES: hypothetical protein [unclassified Variovorax]
MILVKTEAGQQAFRDRTIRLTPRQRSAFFLCDGKRTIEEVQAAGVNIAREDLDEMVSLGMLRAINGVTHDVVLGEVVASPVIVTAEASNDGRSAQDRYKAAYPIATRLSGSLGLRGFRLNLAVEGTSSYEELLALAPRIRAAVGPDRAAELDNALGT